MQSYYTYKRLLSLAAAIIAAACNTAPGPRPDAGGTPVPGKLRSGEPTVEYKPAKYDCVAAQPCSINAPTVGEGAVTYSIAPALPQGMTFDETNGVITGSPHTASPATTYTVTATNSAGKASTNVTITVHAAELAPATLSYATNPANYTVGVAIVANRPTTTGGRPTTFTVTPALPPGLVMDPLTGVISGTSTMIGAASAYIVTASNALGAATAELSIAINDIPPKTLGYSSPSSVFTKGNAATPNTPVVTGGKASSYSVIPALPAGLTLDEATGVISGTPTELMSSTNFTLSANNSGGSATSIVSISVIDVPPTNLRYSLNPAVYALKKSIVANIPGNNGGVPTSYTVSPALPAGLVLDAATGEISGTPNNESSAAPFIVTATNTGGSTSIIVSIEVKAVAPTGLSYAEQSAAYHVHVLITPNLPTTTGAIPTNYAITPELPAGLSMSATTGIISGTPSAAASKGSYKVTASTDAGEVSAILEIEVADDPPTALVYASARSVYQRGTEIAPNRPSNTGGVATAYEVSPALPAGLHLNAATGEITGTPTAVSPEATYMVTASNASGKTETELTITVQEMAPAELTYSHNPASYIDGSKITDNTPSSTGGPIASYSVSPALPTGLTIDRTTGVISGIPVGVAPKATYTVTAANDTDNTTVALELEVKERLPGLYVDNVLLLDKAVSTTYEEPLNIKAGAHTLEIAGTGDYTLTGSISGEGTLTISAEDGNTITMQGAQLNPGIKIVSGTLDLMSLKWAFGSPTRSGTGIIKRYGTPKDLSSELRAWFDASDVNSVFSDASRMSSQRNAGGVVHGWTNLANHALSASTLNGLPMWSVEKDAIVLNNASYTLGNLELPTGGTVIAVVTTTALNGQAPAIFTGTANDGGFPVMLGGDPEFRNLVPTITAAYSTGTDTWIISDSQPITLDQKHIFGMSTNTSGITLQIDGLTVSVKNNEITSFGQAPTYRIGRRWDAVTDFWNGKFYEIVVANGSSSLIALTGYMAWHNNLTAALPENHPHKNAPPAVVISADGTVIK